MTGRDTRVHATTDPSPEIDQHLTRRECLTRGAGAVLAAGAAAAGAWWLHDARGDAGLPQHAERGPQLANFFADVDFPASNPLISIAAGAEGRFEQMVRAAVGGLDPAAGMSRFISKGDVVVIKPNVGFDRAPHLGATTHPEVLRWVIRLCREAGAKRVVVTDNPIEAPAVCFAKSGIAKVAAEEGAEIVLPSEGRFELLAFPPNPSGQQRAAHWPILYRPLAGATKLIGVAPIKDHNLCSASMNLKNWYGLLGGRRNQFHQTIHETISDLAALFSPTLVIADATRVMLRNGPTGGRSSDVKPGGELGRPAVIAAVDPVACDAWCYEKLLGRDPTQLRYLLLSQERIRRQTAVGTRRLGESGWQAYQRAARIATTGV